MVSFASEFLGQHPPTTLLGCGPEAPKLDDARRLGGKWRARVPHGEADDCRPRGVKTFLRQAGPRTRFSGELLEGEKSS